MGLFYCMLAVAAVDSGSSKTRWVRAVVPHLRAAGLSQNSFSTETGCNRKHVPKRIGLIIGLREPTKSHQPAVSFINGLDRSLGTMLDES
jgi:hypothetical protein